MKVIGSGLLKFGDREELTIVFIKKEFMIRNKPGSASLKPESDSQLIYGIRPVIEAINAGKEIDRIYITRNAKGDLMNELKELLKEKNINWQEVPIERILRVTRNNHQDVVCYISPVSYASISNVLPGIFEKGETPLILILDRITDVRNFGAIARTAECAGVNCMIIPYKGAAQVTADAIKTSAGALSRMVICRENNLRHTIDFLQQSGLKVVAATEKGSNTYYKPDYTGPTAIIMGSEEDGVSNDLLRSADELVKIPLLGKISSLNVSVAAGVMLYEVVRQRGK
jgi:23S rRNA (guanosine2251-2'-O)-methyltransferase